MVKNQPANAGDAGSIPGSGRPPGEGNDNRLQYSCLGNSMDGGVWQATVHGVVKSRTQENVVYTYNITLLSLKKDGNTTICDNMDRLEGIMRSEMSRA